MTPQTPGFVLPAHPIDPPRSGATSRRVRVMVAAVLLIPVAFGALRHAEAAGTQHAVAVNGSDANAGTESAPWRTIGHALAALGAGETLVVHGGTYSEHVSAALHPGTSAAPILVRAATGERPIVAGLLWLTSPTWWTFDGLNVTWDPATDNASQHMVKLSGGSNWTFRNAEIWGAHSYAGVLVTANPSNWRITDNCIHDTYPSNSTNQDHNIYVNSGLSAGSGSIDHNLLFNATNGRNVKLGGPTISTTNGTQNVTIAYNTMVNASQNVSISGSSRNNTVDHNIIDRSSENHLIYGYSLTGTGNVASNNVGFDSTRLIDGTNISDGGGNIFPRDPKFDSASGCGGFNTTDPVLMGYGANAGGGAPTASATPAPTASAAPTGSPTATPVPTAPPAPTATPAQGSSTIVSHGSSAAGNATTPSLVIARPAGTAIGDQLVAAVTVRGGTSPIVTPPTGWTLVRSDAISTTIAQYVYRRLAGSSEPSGWTWTFSKSEAAAGTITALAAVDPITPIGSTSGSRNATSSTSIATSATSAATSGGLLVGFYGIARATTIAPAGGMTEGAEAAAGQGTYLATSEVSLRALGGAGATFNPTAMAAAASVSIGQLIVLNPAP